MYVAPGEGIEHPGLEELDQLGRQLGRGPEPRSVPLGREDGGRHLALHHAGRDRENGDAVGSRLAGERLAEAQDSGLARQVGRADSRVGIDAQRLIEAVQSALRSDGNLLEKEQLEKIESFIAKLQTTALSDNRRLITLAMDDLEAETKNFAARRLDESIRRALAGKNIDDFERGILSEKNQGEMA